MAKRVETVSLSNLSKALDRAVALAAKRHDVELSGPNIVLNWEILGRILRTRVTANSGDLLGAATTIAQSAGLKGTPVVTRVGRDILVGVIPGNFNIQF